MLKKSRGIGRGVMGVRELPWLSAVAFICAEAIWAESMKRASDWASRSMCIGHLPNTTQLNTLQQCGLEMLGREAATLLLNLSS